MAAPTVVNLPTAGTWVIVATNVNTCNVIIDKTGGNRTYFLTYVLTGGAAPGAAVPEETKIIGLSADLNHSEKVDVYARCSVDDGDVIVEA